MYGNGLGGRLVCRENGHPISPAIVTPAPVKVTESTSVQIAADVADESLHFFFPRRGRKEVK